MISDAPFTRNPKHALPMKRSLALYVVAAASLASPGLSHAAENWPQWRGPSDMGVSPTGKPVTEWSEEKNVKWKIEVPGSGTGTPIVWNDRIYLVTAIDTGKPPEGADAPAATPNGGGQQEDEPRGERRRGGFGNFGDGPLPEWAKPHDKDNDGKLNEEEQAALRTAMQNRRGGRGGRGGGGFGGGDKPTNIYQFVVLCLDAKTGKTLWQKTAREEVPHEGHHRDHGFASASPVTDGEHLIVSFGSRGIYCFDLEGNKKWEKDFGDMQTRAGFGEGCSPALHDGTVVVRWEHEGESFLAALDAKDGKELWRKERPTGTAWATPVVVENGGAAQIVIPASKSVMAYDLKSGEVVWETDGLTDNVIPSPVYNDKLIFVMSGFRGSKLRAIERGKTGKLSEGNGVAWTADEGTPYVPSPLLYDGRLYFFQGNSDVLTCLDAASGKAHYSRERVEGLRGVYASPVGAGGHVYLLGREGTGVVIKSGDALEVVATNKLDEAFDASPVIVGNDLLLRGHKHLYCIGAAE